MDIPISNFEYRQRRLMEEASLYILECMLFKLSTHSIIDNVVIYSNRQDIILNFEAFDYSNQCLITCFTSMGQRELCKVENIAMGFPIRISPMSYNTKVIIAIASHPSIYSQVDPIAFRNILLESLPHYLLCLLIKRQHDLNHGSIGGYFDLYKVVFEELSK